MFTFSHLKVLRIVQKMQSVFSQSAPSYKNVNNWLIVFKSCRTINQDEHRFGQPSYLTRTEIDTKIYDFVLKKRRSKMEKITNVVGKLED